MSFSLTYTSAAFYAYINVCLIEKLNMLYIIYLDNMVIYRSKKEAKHNETIR